MLKVLYKFCKVILLQAAIMFMNPHRMLLIPVRLVALGGSWFAGKLEDFSQWLGETCESLRRKMWLFGKPLSNKITEEMQQLEGLITEYEEKYKDR